MKCCTKAQKFRELSWSQRWWLVQALVALPLTALGLRFLGLNRLQAGLERGRRAQSGWEPAPGDALLRARDTARLVKIAGRHLPVHFRCLSRSLALWWLLRRQGIRSDLRIGVNPQGGVLEAHAWVECRGWVVNDHDDVHRQFAPFHQAVIPGGET